MLPAMGRFRIVRFAIKRLTYANATATIALFVALGGAAYGVTSLPERSVGPRQIRNRAVTRSAIGFPLQLVATTYRRHQTFPRTDCNAPPPPGTPRTVLCPAVAIEAIHLPGRELEMHLTSPTTVLVTALSSAIDSDPPADSTTLTAALVVDGRRSETRTASISGGRATQLPSEFTPRLSAGTHLIGIEMEAHYDQFGGGVVTITSQVLATLALPNG